MPNNPSISFNPRNALPRPNVKSRLVTPRELGAAWRLDADSLNRGGRNTNVAGQLQRQMNALQIPTQSAVGFHPFQIYQFPASMRKVQSDDDWLRLKVRGGGFGGLGEFDGQTGSGDGAFSGAVSGTDGAFGILDGFFGGPATGGGGGVEYGLYTQFPTNFGTAMIQQPPNDGSLVVPDEWNEALLPNDPTQITYFWASLVPDSDYLDPNEVNPVMCYGQVVNYYDVEFGEATLTNCVRMDTGDVFTEEWGSFPYNDPLHWLIGSAVVLNNQVWIQQFQFSNIMPRFNTSGPIGLEGPWGTAQAQMVFKGPWNFPGGLGIWSPVGYFPGDVVYDTTVTSDTAPNLFICYPQSVNGCAGAITDGPPSSFQPDPWLPIGTMPLPVY